MQAMETRDGRWRVEVGGVGSVVWYRLIGPEGPRALPSTDALLQALTTAGVDLADLVEVTSEPKLAAIGQCIVC